MEWWRGLHSASGDSREMNTARPEGASHVQKRGARVCVCVCVCTRVFCAEGRHANLNTRKTRERGERAREQAEFLPDELAFGVLFP